MKLKKYIFNILYNILPRSYILFYVAYLASILDIILRNIPSKLLAFLLDILVLGSVELYTLQL